MIFDLFREHFFFIGRLLGKALYESQLLDVRMAPFFLASLFTNDRRDVDIVQVCIFTLFSSLPYLLSFHEEDSYSLQMRGVDPIIYNNLIELREMDPSKVLSLLYPF